MNQKKVKAIRRKNRQAANDLVLEFFKQLGAVDVKTRLKVALKVLFSKKPAA